MRCEFPASLLPPARYVITVSACEVAGDRPVALFEERSDVVSFEVSPEGYGRHAQGGLVAPRVQWIEAAKGAES